MLLLAAATAGYHLSASWPAADRPRCAVAAAVPPCSIKVIGIGGGGGNTVNRMVDAVGTESGVDFALMNTDVQALSESRAPETLQIGPECTSRDTPSVAHSRRSSRSCSSCGERFRGM